MTDLSGGRDLPWYLRFQLALQAQTDPNPSENGPFLFPEDPEEEVWVPIKLSQRQFTAIASAVDVGADIAYGTDAIKVFWYLVRSIEHTMALCEQFIECLETDEDVQAALAGQILGNDLIRNAVNQVAGKGAPLLPGELVVPVTTGCDLDELFAQTTGIVDQMNVNNVDFLEILAASTAPARKLAAAIAAIPVIETLPIDDAIDWVAKMQAEIVTNYNAEYTSSLRDTYRCDLFCIAQTHDDCTLTYDDIKTYFNNRLGAALDPLNLLAAVVQYTVLGTWAGTTVVDIMMLNQISIWQVAGDWLGVNLRTLQAVTKISSNYPDSDWTTVCDDCPELWEHTFDFTASNGGFAIWGGPFSGTPGTWVSGQGWVSGFATAGGFAYQMVQINRSIDPTTVTSMSVTYNMTNGANAGLTRLLSADTATLASTTDIPANGIGQVYSGSGTAVDATFVGLRVQAGNAAGGADPGGTCTVTRLVVAGNGIDPFL